VPNRAGADVVVGGLQRVGATPRPLHGRAALSLVAAFAVGACAAGSTRAPIPPALPEPVAVPAGVDSAVAMSADSLAEASFVDAVHADSALELQQKAVLIVEHTDSVWAAMAELLDGGRAVTPEDSAAASDAALAGGLALVRLDSLLRISDEAPRALAARTAILLDSAEVALERSFRMNPFDSRSQVWLAQVYELQARRLGQQDRYDRAIDELQKLVLLTPDQHEVYAMLANNYFYVENWDGAALNYARAEEVYLETWDLTVDDPQPLDSATVFSYVQAQGDMHVQRLDAERATGSYDRALGWARAAEDSAYVYGELEWMAWDDRNIRSAFARDSLLLLEQQGDLEGARIGYGALLEGLTARKAIDETDWRLAIVEYNLGSTEAAAERLRALVARTGVDAEGAPVDDAYARYFDDYGTLCLNLGRTARAERRDNRGALMYYTQATELNWSGRAVAYFEVARLVQGNVSVALQNANEAVALEDSLETEQRLDLYRLLMELHRRTGNFDDARRYRDLYRALRGD
jgi:tetratricopeptide (TPR) repeat protein